jgi:phosphinothricin acetyltransferase
MRFRNATLDDLPEIVDIYNSTIPGKMVTADLTPVSVRDKMSWFSQHDDSKRPLWICMNERNETIGWISLQDFYGRIAYQGCAEISIYIKDRNRGKGLGKLALNFALESCKALNIHTLLGFIFKENLQSIKLFESVGFEVWGELPQVANMESHFCTLLIMGKKITY